MKIHGNHPYFSRTFLRGGFSLLEVMVATSLASVLLLGFLSLTHLGTSQYQLALKQSQARAEAQSASLIFQDDFSTRIMVGDEPWQLRQSNPRFHELIFYTQKPPHEQSTLHAVGDLCLVHYFTAVTPRDPRDLNTYSRKLYRRFYESEETLKFLKEKELPALVADPNQAEAIAYQITAFQISHSQEDHKKHSSSWAIELHVADAALAARHTEASDWEFRSTHNARNWFDEENGIHRILIPLPIRYELLYQ